MTYKLRQISPAVFSTQTTQDSLGGTPQAPPKALPTKATPPVKRALVLEEQEPATESKKAKSPAVCTATKGGGVKREASKTVCPPPACKSHLPKPSSCVKQEIPTKVPSKQVQPSPPPSKVEQIQPSPKGVSPQGANVPKSPACKAKPTTVPVKCVKSDDGQSAKAAAEAKQTTAVAPVDTDNGAKVSVTGTPEAQETTAEAAVATRNGAETAALPEPSKAAMPKPSSTSPKPLAGTNEDTANKHNTEQHAGTLTAQQVSLPKPDVSTPEPAIRASALRKPESPTPKAARVTFAAATPAAPKAPATLPAKAAAPPPSKTPLSAIQKGVTVGDGCEAGMV